MVTSYTNGKMYYKFWHFVSKKKKKAGLHFFWFYFIVTNFSDMCTKKKFCSRSFSYNVEFHINQKDYFYITMGLHYYVVFEILTIYFVLKLKKLISLFFKWFI